MLSTDDLMLCCRVISLHPQAYHTQVVLESLRAQGVDAEIFAAVDGRKAMPALLRGECFNNNLAMIRHGKLLTSSELGCYLSHLRVVCEAYERGCEHLCVFEDDVVLEEGFGEVLRASLQLEGVEMLRYMELRLRPRKVLAELASSGYVLTRPVRGAVGAQAYLLNRVGMKKFITHAQTIYEPVDKVFDHFWLFDLALYGVEPHTVYELEHETSIAKEATAGVAGPTLLQRLCYHPVKLWFSLRRHYYWLSHRSDFSPAKIANERPGRTKRMR